MTPGAHLYGAGMACVDCGKPARLSRGPIPPRIPRCFECEKAHTRQLNRDSQRRRRASPMTDGS